MDYKYIPDINKPSCYIFDMDGTLSIMSGRIPHEWSRVGEDTVNEPIKDILLKLKPYHKVIIMTGRDGICEKETAEWLTKNLIPYNGLVMRTAGDNRKDNIVKLELFKKHIADNYNVMGVFDDRDSVVKMWRDIGLTCLQANYGAF